MPRKTWAEKTPAQRAAQIARQRKYVAENREAVAVRLRAWHEKNRDKVKTLARARTLQQKYGITPADYDLMLDFQGRRCACCRSERAGGPHGVFAVDHDHETNVVRGLLCFRCNTMIGRAEENPDILTMGAAYLRRHGKLGLGISGADPT